MPAIPGTFDGQHIKDKRTFYLSDGIQAWYRARGWWDRITDVRGQETSKGECITVWRGKTHDTWRLEESRPHYWVRRGYLEGSRQFLVTVPAGK